VPMGNPAPPRPRRPARSNSAIVASGPSSLARVRPRPPPSASHSSSDMTGWSGRTISNRPMTPSSHVVPRVHRPVALAPDRASLPVHARQHGQPQRNKVMSDKETGPRAAVEGVAEDLKGKAKEVAGIVSGNEE